MGRTARVRVAITAVTSATLAFALTGCGSGGDLAFDNAGTTSVVLGAGCTDGDVEFTFSSGTTVTVEGPVCPDQEFVIGDDDVQLQDRQDV